MLSTRRKGSRTARNMFNFSTPPYQTRRAAMSTLPLAIPQSNRCRIPCSAAPEKYKLEMPVEEFRTWKTSMSWWLKLNAWAQTEAVGYIRLSCEPSLQRALDAKYTVQQWASLATEEALEAIKQITVQPSNQAADKDIFYNLKQGTYESISAYFTRAYTVAANCGFQCPNCEHNLGEYLLLSKLAVGLSDSTLRKEVFRSCEVLDSVSDLRSFCMAYETAMKAGVSVQYGGNNLEIAVGAQEDVGARAVDPVAASISRQNFPRYGRRQSTTKFKPGSSAASSCGHCDKEHAPGNCPAERFACNYCGVKGILKWCAVERHRIKPSW